MAFYRLERLINLYDGYRCSFRVNGVPLLLIQDEGQLHLLLDQCPHKAFPLNNGSLRNGVLRCAWHGMEFNLRDGGRCLQHPSDCLRRFLVRYEGDSVGVELE